MVAEWFDVGEGSGWEAYDDGSLAYVQIMNSDVLCEVLLTETGAPTIPTGASVHTTFCASSIHTCMVKCLLYTAQRLISLSIFRNAGFLFLGAPAGPLQPYKPEAILVVNGSPARQLTIQEVRGLDLGRPHVEC